MNQLVTRFVLIPPAFVAAAGLKAQTRFWDFFIANIHDPNTRST